jgi:hypothetical protein
MARTLPITLLHAGNNFLRSIFAVLSAPQMTLFIICLPLNS